MSPRILLPFITYLLLRGGGGGQPTHHWLSARDGRPVVRSARSSTTLATINRSAPAARLVNTKRPTRAALWIRLSQPVEVDGRVGNNGLRQQVRSLGEHRRLSRPHGPGDDEKWDRLRRHYLTGPSGNVTAISQSPNSMEPNVEEARIVSLALGSDG